jgi:dynein heavy chain 1, cytosolic
MGMLVNESILGEGKLTKT